MYAVETQYQPTVPTAALAASALSPAAPGQALGQQEDLPQPRMMDRLSFVQLVHRHLNQARRHATCPAVVMVTMQTTELMAAGEALAQRQEWMHVLHERLRLLLRRSDLVLPLEGSCVGVILLDTQAQALPKIQQRLAKAMAWPMGSSIAAQRPELRMGAAMQEPHHGQDPCAESLVWAAEQALQPVAAEAGAMN